LSVSMTKLGENLVGKVQFNIQHSTFNIQLPMNVGS
jgi:hypothetical protein